MTTDWRGEEREANRRPLLASATRWLGASLVACWPALAVAQYTDPATPADSPLWWPILDGITSEELRLRHQRDAVATAYRLSVEAGQAPDCGPDYVPRRFADSGMNPELAPVWFVLQDRFVRATTPNRDVVAEHERELRRYGMSRSGLDALSRFVSRASADQKRRQNELEDASAPMGEIVLRFMAENPPPTEAALRSYASAVADGELDAIDRQMFERGKAIDDLVAGAGDPLALSALVGGTHAEWVEWIELSRADPEQDSMELHLPVLRKELSDADWTALRTYLATVIGNQQLGVWSLVDCPQAHFFVGQPALLSR